MGKYIYDKKVDLWYELQLWAQRMNNIRDRVNEIVNHDLIFA